MEYHREEAFVVHFACGQQRECLICLILSNENPKTLKQFPIRSALNKHYRATPLKSFLRATSLLVVKSLSPVCSFVSQNSNHHSYGSCKRGVGQIGYHANLICMWLMSKSIACLEGNASSLDLSLNFDCIEAESQNQLWIKKIVSFDFYDCWKGRKHKATSEDAGRHGSFDVSMIFF